MVEKQWRVLYGTATGEWLLGSGDGDTTPPPQYIGDLIRLGDPGMLVQALWCDGWRQTDLATLLGVGQTAVSRYVGNIAAPDLPTVGWAHLTVAAYELVHGAVPVTVADLGYPAAGWDLVDGQPVIVVDSGLSERDRNHLVSAAQADVRAWRRRTGAALASARGGLVTA